MIIDLVPYMQRATEYAESCDHTTIYGKRDGQTNPVKRIRDSRNGHLAEWVVYETGIVRGIQLTEPDSNVYTPENKRFSPDLTDSKGRTYAVKSCEVGRRISWVFQKSDRHWKTASLVCLVTLDMANLRGKVEHILAPTKIVPLLRTLDNPDYTTKEYVWHADIQSISLSGVQV